MLPPGRVPTYNKSVRCPVAKEVGMGNPAEKTTRHPTKEINSILPYFGKYFFAWTARTNKKASRYQTQLIVHRRFSRDSRNRLLAGEDARAFGCKLLRLRMFRCGFAAGFFHAIHQTRAGGADIRVARENISLLGDLFPAASANP